ncbi:MAG: SsgA family sporulation/cell division regulator [Actinomycetes bacterium]
MARLAGRSLAGLARAVRRRRSSSVAGVADIPVPVPLAAERATEVAPATPATLARELTMAVVRSGSPKLVPVSMRYDTADPYAVCADFPCGQGPRVSWVLARDLLWQGLNAPVGDGDVRVWPSGNADDAGVFISLRSPDGEALVHAANDEVVAFLQASYRLCPPGTEANYLDVDDDLRRLCTS